MLKKKTCPICHRDFETTKPNKKYCSFSCREAGQQLHRLKWEDRNQGYSAAYMKKYRAERREGGGDPA